MLKSINKINYIAMWFKRVVIGSSLLILSLLIQGVNAEQNKLTTSWEKSKPSEVVVKPKQVSALKEPPLIKLPENTNIALRIYNSEDQLVFQQLSTENDFDWSIAKENLRAGKYTLIVQYGTELLFRNFEVDEKPLKSLKLDQ